MSKPIFRTVLLVLVLLSLVFRLRAQQTIDAIKTDIDMRVVLTQFLGEQGLTLKENPIKPPNLLASVVYFQRPECREPSMVMPFALNIEVRPLWHWVFKPGFEQRIIYLDGEWATQNRPGIFLEWIKQFTLDVVGLTRYFPIKIAIVVGEPADCGGGLAIDWRQLWDRARYGTAGGAASALASRDGRK